MDSVPQAPYYAPAEDLPAALPTVEEIKGSTEFLGKDKDDMVKVARVGPHFVVKYGTEVSVEEGRTMMFIRRATSVRLPTIYAYFQDVQGLNSYLIMEHIPGEGLDQLWESLSDAQKQLVKVQLTEYFAELRRLPSPGGYCSVDKNRLGSYLLRSGSEVRTLARGGGPFNTESEFNEGLLNRYRVHKFKDRIKFFSQGFAETLKDHPPTFSHGDLFRINILFDPQSEKVTVIDWENSGWYPSYWDSALATHCGKLLDDGWMEVTESALGMYPTESVLIFQVIRDEFVFLCGLDQCY